MPRVACLHTAASNVSVLEAARPAGVELLHEVRPALLAAAEAAGGLFPDLATETAEALRRMATTADAVLLTCSTLGPAAALAGVGAATPVLRADAALARAAGRVGGRVVVLCAALATLATTVALFGAETDPGTRVFVSLVPDAWDIFRAGEEERYLRLVAAAADAAALAGASAVVLAQVSMALAAPLCRAAAPLTSPAAGLRAALAAAGHASR